jgi:hypothetical protein
MIHVVVFSKIVHFTPWELINPSSYWLVFRPWVWNNIITDLVSFCCIGDLMESRFRGGLLRIIQSMIIIVILIYWCYPSHYQFLTHRQASISRSTEKYNQLTNK